jgi:thioredoxin-dependent peroxiredoxin
MRIGVRMILAGWTMALLGLAVTSGQEDTAEKKTALEVGQIAPKFEASDEDGRTWQSARHVGKKIVVVYFYPGDFTPGCTSQAQKFRDNMNRISDLGAEVVGISGDTPVTHALFKKAYHLNFSLLADEEGTVAKQFGVPIGPGADVKARDADKKLFEFKRPATAARWTFIIGLDGKIAYKNTKVDPVKDSLQIEGFLKDSKTK